MHTREDQNSESRARDNKLKLRKKKRQEIQGESITDMF